MEKLRGQEGGIKAVLLIGREVNKTKWFLASMSLKKVEPTKYKAKEPQIAHSYKLPKLVADVRW